MAISINWTTKVITIPQADLTFISSNLYELDIDLFRLELKNIEDSDEGMAFLDTHRHNTDVTVGGVTLARVVEIINGYTITFQDIGTPYAVNLIGANSNISDITNINNVSIRSANSAGLIITETAQYPSSQSIRDAMALAYNGSIAAESIDAKIANLPQLVTNNMNATTYDGVRFDELLQDLLSMAAGKIIESPGGIFTFYERDNTTPRYVLKKIGAERQRL